MQLYGNLPYMYSGGDLIGLARQRVRAIVKSSFTSIRKDASGSGVQSSEPLRHPDLAICRLWDGAGPDLRHPG